MYFCGHLPLLLSDHCVALRTELEGMWCLVCRAVTLHVYMLILRVYMLILEVEK